MPNQVRPEARNPSAMMVDALLWYDVSGMQDLIRKYLDPDDVLQIDADLNFDNWPPKRVATELAKLIQAHDLIDKAVLGMRKLQARAPDLNVLASALGV